MAQAGDLARLLQLPAARERAALAESEVPARIGPAGTERPPERTAMYERRLTMQLALLAKVHTLRGHDLACWRAPLPCHCDVLLRLANEGSG